MKTKISVICLLWNDFRYLLCNRYVSVGITYTYRQKLSNSKLLLALNIAVFETILLDIPVSSFHLDLFKRSIN